MPQSLILTLAQLKPIRTHGIFSHTLVTTAAYWPDHDGPDYVLFT
jgi:hypothetical protein